MSGRLQRDFCNGALVLRVAAPPARGAPLVRANYFFFFFAAFFFFIGIGSSPPFRKRDRRRADQQRVAAWSENRGGEGAPRPLRRHHRASITYGSALSARVKACQERGRRGVDDRVLYGAAHDAPDRSTIVMHRSDAGAGHTSLRLAGARCRRRSPVAPFPRTVRSRDRRREG